MKVHSFNVSLIDSYDIRLSDFIKGKFPLLSTGQSVKKAFKRKQIFVDGVLAYSGDYVRPDTIIEHRIILESLSNQPTLEIVLEEDDFLIINKPPGILSSGQGKISIQKALMHHEIISSQSDALPFPKLVHRLDRDTSGLIIAAKTQNALHFFGKLLEDHNIDKEYIALVEGHLDPLISNLETDIDNKTARTEIIETYPLDTKDAASYVKLRIHTGRTHQIRIHFNEIGHPLIGDMVYNRGGLAFGRGLFLQAVHLSFVHPVDGEKRNIDASPHKKFLKYLRKGKKNAQD